MREGSAPNFAPPVEEGLLITLQDEKGDLVVFEFLGLILHNGSRYGFFVESDEEGNSNDEAIIILEVTELDEDDQPAGLEMIEDEALLNELFEQFKEATKDLYDFE
ncbi:MAG: DUF1292 domain-containing protein [Anaerotardibacter sp.]